MTRDELRSVLPGGKWHEVAMKWVADPAAVLQWRDHRGDWCIWTIHTSAPFDPHYEWRIKPQVLRYRVALFHGNKGGYVNIAEREETAESWAKHPDFIRWLGDWQEAEL